MPIVTISQGAYSGGHELATGVAAKLGCRAVSREVILEGAKKYNIMAEDLERDISRIPGLFERLIRESNRYVIFVKAAVLSTVQQEDVVYYGQAGQVFLEGVSHVLKVKLETPLEQRVRRLVAARGIDEQNAAQELRQADKDQDKWIRTLYERDWLDPTLYDLTINLASMTIETAAEIVAHGAKQPAFEPTPASLQRLNDLRLESETMAAIAADDKLHDERLEVSASGGSVTVRGYVKNDTQKKLLEETIKLVKGVEKAQVYVSQISDGFSRRAP